MFSQSTADERLQARAKKGARGDLEEKIVFNFCVCGNIFYYGAHMGAGNGDQYGTWKEQNRKQ